MRPNDGKLAVLTGKATQAATTECEITEPRQQRSRNQAAEPQRTQQHSSETIYVDRDT